MSCCYDRLRQTPASRRRSGLVLAVQTVYVRLWVSLSTSRGPAARAGCSSGSAAAIDSEVDATRVDAVEQPAPVRLVPQAHDLHGRSHSGIRLGARLPEVVERAQHVVVPVAREGEVEIRRIGDLAGAPVAEQAALEQVLP